MTEESGAFVLAVVVLERSLREADVTAKAGAPGAVAPLDSLRDTGELDGDLWIRHGFGDSLTELRIILAGGRPSHLVQGGKRSLGKPGHGDAVIDTGPGGGERRPDKRPPGLAAAGLETPPKRVELRALLGQFDAQLRVLQNSRRPKDLGDTRLVPFSEVLPQRCLILRVCRAGSSPGGEHRARS
jgi:hypothetical protein